MGFILDECVIVGRVGPIRMEIKMDVDVSKQTIVWLCFRREVSPDAEGRVVSKYHVIGVGVESEGQSAEEFAKGMCQDESYFIMPMPVNVALPHDRIDWPHYFPLATGPQPLNDLQKREESARRFIEENKHEG